MEWLIALAVYILVAILAFMRLAYRWEPIDHQAWGEVLKSALLWPVLWALL